MPTILRSGPYRLFFYSNEADEPPHVHAQREDKLAKFWLSPIALAASAGFRGHELRTLERLVREERTEILEAWNEYFAGTD